MTLLVGCFPPGEGLEVPLNDVYFPVGVALDADASHLFVVNSDFDLQYNAGSVQSWDLEALRSDVRRYQFGTDCGGLENERDPQDRLLYPGRCKHFEPVIVQAVEIGAFATDVVFRSSPAGDGTGRLFVPVRGDATLHWIDVGPGGELECGNKGTREDSTQRVCDDAHRAGDNEPTVENGRYQSMLGEPFGVDASEDGRIVLVSHQTSGAVGLLENDWSGSQPPELTVRYWFTHSGLYERPMGVAALPEPKLAPALKKVPYAGYYPGFLVGYRTTPVISLIRAYLDTTADPARPYTEVTLQSPIYANSSGSDSRGIAVDGSRRQEQERICMERFGVDEACAKDPECASAVSPAYVECLTTASAVPLDVYVPNRAPASLVIGQSQAVNDDLATSDAPVFVNSVPVDLGPTRVVMGDITNPAGELERRAFVVCFDSRRIVIYDPKRRRIEGQIVTGRGPQALAVDGANGLGYVAHFTDSYIGVIDLDQGRPTFGTIVATVAEPSEPRASK
ncbi:MAG TPA: hypothetical protein VGK73_28745 [Polyangiaceae bacterium]